MIVHCRYFVAVFAAAVTVVGLSEPIGASKVVRFDVAVVGGGVAGVPAALASARAGARTVLIERGAQVGGSMTVGGVTFPGLFHAWGRQVIAGIGWEMVTNAVAEAGGALPDFAGDVGAEHWRHQIRVNPFVWTALAEEKLGAAGVLLRYHTAPAKVERKDGRWRMMLSSDGELSCVDATVLVDATGNGALAALCGAERLGGETARQPGGFTYLVNPHAKSSDLDIPRLERLREEAIQKGTLKKDDLCRGVRFFVDECNAMLSGFSKGPDHGTTIANYVDGADNSTADSRAETNLRGRASMLRVYRFLRSSPGLEKSEIVWSASEVGVRETWRVKGDYVLTGDDYVSGRRFDDAICHSFYPIDVHSSGAGVVPRHLARGVVPQIPYRALLAANVTNVLVAGRCLSADRIANSAVRVQATCMATGQAAGEAAAFAALQGCDVRDLPVAELKSRLSVRGAIVP